MASDTEKIIQKKNPPKRKPRYFGKKNYYKKLCACMEHDLKDKNAEIARLKERILHLYTKGKEQASTIFGSRIMVGDHNIMTTGLDDEWEETISHIQRLLETTSHNCRQSAEKLAETCVEIETLKTALHAVSRNINRVDRTTTSTESKVDYIHNLIKLAQDPNPTDDDVNGAVVILQDMIRQNRLPTTAFSKLSDIPTKAQRLPQMLALKFDTPKKEEFLQRALLGDVRPVDGRIGIEDKCANWLVRWVRCHGMGTDAAKDLTTILHSLDERIIQDRKDKIMRETVFENESMSSSSLDVGTLVEDMTYKEILSKLSILNPVPMQMSEIFCKLQNLEQVANLFKLHLSTAKEDKEILLSSGTEY